MRIFFESIPYEENQEDMELYDEETLQKIR